MRSDDASAGGLFGLFAVFVICALFIGMMGGVVDRLGQTQNRMVEQANTPGNIPVSQDRIDTFAFLTNAFAIMAFMIMLAGGINYWINSIREQSGEV